MRWRRGEVIGVGAFGKVYLGMNLDTGELMAVKVLERRDRDRGRREGEGKEEDDALAVAEAVASVAHEVSVLRNLSHPNIVRYLGADRSPPDNSPGNSLGSSSSTASPGAASSVDLAIFLEYVPGGSVRGLLDRFGAFDDSVVRIYSRQVRWGGVSVRIYSRQVRCRC